MNVDQFKKSRSNEKTKLIASISVSDGAGDDLFLQKSRPEPAEDIELAGNHDNEDDYTIDTTAAHQTLLKGSSITVTGTGSSGSGTIVTISKAGIYSISGTLSKGQVIVTTSDKEDVKLVFNGVNITNNGVPVVIQSAEKTVINLAAGTENTLTDAKTYVFEGLSDEPNAALFSKSDSTIFEEGKLTLNANYNDGIASKDGLIMSSGNFTVNAIDDGIRGNDYLIVRGGHLLLLPEAMGLNRTTNTMHPKVIFNFRSKRIRGYPARGAPCFVSILT